MNLLDLSKIGLHHARGAVAEELYLKTGLDYTKPVSIYAEIIEKCNYKCGYCDYWRRPNYRDEMSIQEWKKGLLSLKKFIGNFHIEFSGGEPYIKKGIMDLIDFLGEEKVKWGITTNGGSFHNQKIVEKTVLARPFNINISVDSPFAETHNYQRGIDNSLQDITQGIKNLIEAQKKHDIHFPIIIKAVVTKQNFRDMPALVKWVQEVGATSLNFQPVDKVTDEVDKEFWIGEELLPELTKVTDELRAMKKAGAPILSSDLLLSLWGAHFREESAPKEALPCVIGLRNFFIRSDGRVETCWFFEPIGNLRTHSAEEIWKSEEARQNRKDTVGCDKLCLFTCLSQKKLSDKVKMGLQLLRPRKLATA